MAYEWQIANFDALESGLKVKTCSPTFSLGGHSWQLELYPGGYRPDALEHVAAFLRYKGGRAAVRVQFSLSVVSRHGSHVAWRSDETQPVLMGAAPDRALKVKKKRGLLRRLSSRKFNASSKVTHSFSLTGMRRNLKFALGVMPITIKYLRVKMRASKMRKRLKKKEPESYYEQRTKLWDETHETSAVQVHAATLYDGRRAIVKVIYPDIRANMRADLANARVASKQIVALMDMPLKDTIDVIMNEFCENFPRSSTSRTRQST
ncbi:hypothetical protein JL722_8707 [Aureococcus anophagefferens]|nr:hypothetical protein JL722_8707 [Aureococcus anophagefferens]